jgi:hypothetical protein
MLIKIFIQIYTANSEIAEMKSFTGTLDQRDTRMTPNRKIIASLAFATVCLTAIATVPVARAEMNASGVEVITNGPQLDRGDRSGAPLAQQNVRDSGRYDALIGSNANFRAVRERKECGPIDDAKMHSDCLATFDR